MSELPFKIGFPYVVFSCQLITKNRKHFKQSTGAPSKSWVGGPQRSHAFSAPKRLVCWTNVATKKSAGFLWWFFSYKPYLKVWWLKTYKRLLCPNSTSWMRAMQQTNPLSVDFFYDSMFFLHRWMCNSICRIAQLIFLGDDFLVLTGQLLDSRAPWKYNLGRNHVLNLRMCFDMYMDMTQISLLLRCMFKVV